MRSTIPASIYQFALQAMPAREVVDGLELPEQMFVLPTLGWKDCYGVIDDSRPAGVEYVLSLIMWWTDRCVEYAADLEASSAHHARLFYRDAIIRDFMIRLRIVTMEEGRRELAYSVARLHIASGEMENHFLTQLLAGLERIAVKHDASLLFEFADPRIKPKLRKRGYVSSNREESDDNVTGLGDHWTFPNFQMAA